MKVAVPLFGEEISPRFGGSAQMLLATVEPDGINVEGIEDLSQTPPWQWAGFLAERGVSIVICGGIHHQFQEDVERRGIQVIWGVIGPAADALAALQKGALHRNQFIYPGRRRRHRHRGGGGHGWGGAGSAPLEGWGPPGHGFAQRRFRGFVRGKPGS